MSTMTPDHDPRYLAGIVLFNRGDYFEAHEVWELLWLDGGGTDRQFYQGLIQAAVGLCHFCNGNLRGAVKLYHSSRDYLERYGSEHLGLNLAAFREQMWRCFGPLLAHPNPGPDLEPNEDLLPVLTLAPEPLSWPDPAQYLEEEGHGGGDT